ncbi:MAG: PhzF family phenazine biosynthesis protein [Maricaulaceae bacterium]
MTQAQTITSFIIDSFTDAPFKGNPAAVCFVEGALTPAQMQNIATEFGLSETAFVQAMEAGFFSIRYFSPKMEIDLCGHATLAAIKALVHAGRVGTSVRFITGAGLELTGDIKGEVIDMHFPVFTTERADAPQALCGALGISGVINAEFCAGIKSLLVEIDDVELLRKLTPDYSALVASHTGIDGVCVTARSDQTGYDFESRYFWPWSGTDEDPVTGSAHSMLAPYWYARLGKTSMRALQCSARGGFMNLNFTPNEGLIISAQAQVILKGELYI